MRQIRMLRRILPALMLTVVHPQVIADTSLKRAADALGPVTIKADRAEWQKGGAMIYSGNVRLESGGLLMTGTQLELRQFGNGQFKAQIGGGPATLNHAGMPESSEAIKRVPVSATARELTYDSRSDIIEITGKALLDRGSDKVRGERIRYDVVERRIQAAGGGSGQVQIVITPPSRQKPSEKLPADSDSEAVPDDEALPQAERATDQARAQAESADDDRDADADADAELGEP